MNSVSLYVYSDRISKDGVASVYVATSLHGKPVRFPVGFRCYVNQIDFEKNVILKSDPAYADKNLIISSTIARITDIFVRYRLMWRELTKERLQQEYALYTSNKDFHAYATYKLQQRKEQLASGTYRRHESQLGKIKEFAPSLFLRDIDEAWINRYIAWCRKVRGNKQGSIRSSTNVVKYYVGQAIKDKILAENPFKEVTVPEGDAQREFLTEEELQRVVNIYRSNQLPDGHRRVMRYFLFSCFCGLRISDVASLKEEHIVGDYLVIVPHKTTTTSSAIVNIPITPQMRSLMGDVQPGRHIFKVYSEYRTNIMVKEVMQLAKIKKHITFHCARHTFATIFLRHSENVVMLQKLLGHKKIEQTLVYAHLVRNDAKEKMHSTFAHFSL